MHQQLAADLNVIRNNTRVNGLQIPKFFNHINPTKAYFVKRKWFELALSSETTFSVFVQKHLFPPGVIDLLKSEARASQNNGLAQLNRPLLARQ